MRGSRRGQSRDAEEGRRRMELPGGGGRHSGRALPAGPPDTGPPPSVRDRMAAAATALTGCRARVGGQTLLLDDPLPGRDDDAHGGAAAGYSLHGYAHPGLLDGMRGRGDAAAERPRLPPAPALASSEPPASPRILFGGLRAQLRSLAAANAPHLLQAPGASWEEEDPLCLPAAAFQEDLLDETPHAAHDTAPSPATYGARYAPLLRLEEPVATVSGAHGGHSARGGPLLPGVNHLQQDLDATWPVGVTQAPRPRVEALQPPPQRGLQVDPSREELPRSSLDALDAAFAVTP